MHLFSCAPRHAALLAAILASLAIASVVKAQESLERTVPDLGTSTEQIATTSPVSLDRPTWYQVEEIMGNQIDVGDFVVGPGRTEVVVRPGESVVRYITVTNRISDGRAFKLVVEDIAGTNDGSASVRLLGDERGPYTIKDYISFPGDIVYLDLGERAVIPVTISLPPNASPGGFYGSVLVTTVTDEGEALSELSGGAARSPIVARIGTLFFVTVPGDVVKSGELRQFSTVEDRWWYERGPINFALTFENTGSLHLGLYGEIEITNMFGEEVGFVELEPWFVLPQSLRLREVTWDREWLLGRYTATARINRGYDDVIDERSLSFWVLPWKVVGGIFAVLFIIFFSLRAFFRTFEFKRKGS